MVTSWTERDENSNLYQDEIHIRSQLVPKVLHKLSPKDDVALISQLAKLRFQT